MLKKIGRYEITGELGRGAMGVVYKAHDPVIDRIIAIKLIKIDPASLGVEHKEIKSRFIREAQSAGTLSHPNIITIYDVGEKKNKAYIAMEYVDGKTFAQIIAEGKKLNYEQIFNLFSQIAGALDYAHKKGIIHRDIKPANIMLTKEGRVKICDFGIAKITSSAHTTKTGIIMGTPFYMSPEQIKGEKTIDGRSDIFSLGIVLYELLSGEIPFKGETTSILYKIVHEDPPPPKLIMKDLPKFYETIILKALAKNPDDRYKNCTEFARALILYKSKYLKKKKGKTAEKEDMEHAATVVYPGVNDYSLSESEATAIVDDSYQPLTEREEAPAKKYRISRTIILGFIMLILIGGASFFGLLNWERLKMIFSPSQVQPEKIEKLETVLNLFRKKPISRNIYINSDPSGAAIFSDGKDTGLQTPANLRLSGRKGDIFNIVLKKPFCDNISKQIELNNNTPENFRLNLQPHMKEIFIETQPTGATIELNEKELLDKTPAKIKLEYYTENNLRLILKGYYDKNVELKPQELNENISYELDVIPEPGFFQLRGIYPVDIYLNGKLIASAASNKRIEIQPGIHNIRIINKEFFLNRTIRFKITSKRTTDFSLPPLGKINILANPSNCKIYVDGKFLDYPPISNRNIVVGKHNIKATWANGKKQTKVTEIRAGKGEYLNFNVQNALK